MSGKRSNHSTKMEPYVYFDLTNILMDNVKHRTELVKQIVLLGVLNQRNEVTP